MIRRTLTMIAALVSCASFSHTEETSQSSRGMTIEEEESKPKVTALYMLSTERDYIGQGKTKSYLEGRDGKFIISSNYHKGITIRYVEPWVENRYGADWTIDFSAPKKGLLKPGIYKDAARFPFNNSDQPGFSIAGCGRGCNESRGEFEILEIKYDDAGKVEAFAANFIQKCEKTGPPLFGSVRYNSAEPFEERFTEIFEEEPETVLYIVKCDSSGLLQSSLFRNEDIVISFRQLPYGGEGIEICIESSQGSWVFDFAAPLDGIFGVGYYGGAARYPFHSSIYPGIGVSTPEGDFTQPIGKFEVKHLVKDKDGKIKALALEFNVENQYGEHFQGTIRFNSSKFFD